MSHKITEKAIWVTQGDSLPILLDFHQDITDAEIRMQVRNESGTVMIEKKTKDHLNALKGHSLIKLTGTDTDIPVGRYVTDMEIIFADDTRYTFYPPKVGVAACFHVVNQITKEDL